MTIDVSPAIVSGKSGTSAPSTSTEIAGERRVATAQDYSETIARPIFNSSRRPIEAGSVKQAARAMAPPIQPLQLQLIGVAALSARGQRALVRPVAERNGIWMSIGDEVGGWRLLDIGQDAATFVSGANRQVLLLNKPSEAQ